MGSMDAACLFGEKENGKTAAHPAPGGAVPSLHRGLLAAFLTALLSSDLSLDTFYNSISSFLSQNVLNCSTATTLVFIASILPFKYS